MARATFAGGCFWGTEEAFRTLDGVIETTVGYMGGTTENPTYEMVCTGATGHAEVVDINFDPAIISYRQLLEHFWTIHNPTSLNFQGVDHGTQYRSVIYYYNDEQRQKAEESKAALDVLRIHLLPVVTEITQAGPFWRAEGYHQQYFLKQKSD
ncbi:MAG: peptide-methionine (S)-S-oxide reductase MsrA [Thermodesulfobacteriota bacterium]|nr:peptide-methionine (S)-S-oxide reductase MsrA [Thermodesulfobacteriota bacterium]